MVAFGPVISANTTYHVIIDGEAFTLSKCDPTAWELLVLAGKAAPEERVLYLTGGGHPSKLGAEDRIELERDQVTTFISREANAAQGLGKGRRELELPAADAQWLDNLGLVYETIDAADGPRVILYRCPMPAGYTVDWADIDLMLRSYRPQAPIGAVGFSPALSRKDGKAIRATSDGQFDGRVWQTWQREPAENSPWQSTLDSLSTQFVVVEDWLSRELRRA